MHGFDQFQQEYGSDKNLLNFCTDPDYLSASVLDTESKIQLSHIDYKYQGQEIKQTLQAEYTQQQKQNLQHYLTEFARRRNLSFDVFPDSFLNWLNIPQLTKESK